MNSNPIVVRLLDPEFWVMIVVFMVIYHAGFGFLYLCLQTDENEFQSERRAGTRAERK
ncbi:hypothetical protein [Bartonella sp. ML70XJBT]|uniref:hypothetical protein n=1 Tax=Bartonella sp. ML70XJBT TaxID=3019096 RepID=UPI002361959D|nr:hypothetical protein [Bartonella sp. ML70XJBT]